MVAGGAEDPRRPPLACHVCGCTEDRACLPFGCSWVRRRPALCSSCMQFFQNLRDAWTRARLLRAVDLQIKIPAPAPPSDLARMIAELGGRIVGDFLTPAELLALVEQPQPRRRRR